MTREMWRSPDNKVHIATDERQWVISDITVVKEGENKGKELLTNHRYHYKLEAAIECAARRIAHKNAVDLRAFIQVHKDTARMLSDVVAPF